jgi:hypothetical protein
MKHEFGPCAVYLGQPGPIQRLACRRPTPMQGSFLALHWPEQKQAGRCCRLDRSQAFSPEQSSG